MSRENTCCFTGHRPHKIHFGYDERHRDCMALKLRLSLFINRMYDDGVRTFMTGMAEGVDLWAAEYVCALKEEARHVRLVAVIPYEGQVRGFQKPYKALYQTVRAAADEVVVLHEKYRFGCMRERNAYMVDHSAHLIAVYNGSQGGTRETLRYAKQKGLRIVAIDPRSPMEEVFVPEQFVM